MIYRFDGDIAVPAAMFAAGKRIFNPLTNQTWPHSAPNSNFLWVDQNGNGRFDTDEFQKTDKKIKPRQIDADGTVWAVKHGFQGVFKIPFDGFSPAGVPKWTISEAVGPVMPESDITYVSRIVVLPGGKSAV